MPLVLHVCIWKCVIFQTSCIESTAPVIYRPTLLKKKITLILSPCHTDNLPISRPDWQKAVGILYQSYINLMEKNADDLIRVETIFKSLDARANIRKKSRVS